MKIKLDNCWCGARPRLKTICNIHMGRVYSYHCKNPNCENHTFNTKKLECAVELWNAAVYHRISKT